MFTQPLTDVRFDLLEAITADDPAKLAHELRQQAAALLCRAEAIERQDPTYRGYLRWWESDRPRLSLAEFRRTQAQLDALYDQQRAYIDERLGISWLETPFAKELQRLEWLLCV